MTLAPTANVAYKDTTAAVIQHDARDLPLDDGTVDLVVTSPPYFALRSYRDGGEHYDGQLGSEATPQEFVDNLVACTAEWVRVLKPGGSIWVNLGDKYAGAGPQNAPGRLSSSGNSHHWQQVSAMRSKSLMGLPWRYALACIDQLGLILRAEVIWSKPNGLPESVTDRVRRSHEQWFHFTVEPRYFSAVDEIREPHKHPTNGAIFGGPKSVGQGIPRYGDNTYDAQNPLGRLPGSVWTVPTEPLTVPDELGVDHFAAFPQEWPRRIIQGWTPNGLCVECGEGRRPVYEREVLKWQTGHKKTGDSVTFGGGRNMTASRGDGLLPNTVVHHQSGYECDCPDTDAPTRPAVVLDPFGGTGTTAGVARVLGRYGISNDLSSDYNRLAVWRIWDSGHFNKAEQRMWADRQSAMF